MASFFSAIVISKTNKAFLDFCYFLENFKRGKSVHRAKMCATGKKPILMMKVDQELPMAQRTMRQHVLIAVHDMHMTTTGSILL